MDERKSRQHGAHAIASGHDTDRKSSTIRKPPRHQADDTDIDDAGPDAAQEPVGQEQRPHAVDMSRGNPAKARKRRADCDERPRTEPIDEPPLRRREQRLHHDQH
jgi:hypothetical protein